MEAYRRVYRLIYYAGQSSTAVAGVLVIVMLTVLGGDIASSAIPYGTLWVLFCGSMRLLMAVLRRPSAAGRSVVPIEKVPPKAVLAVSITDAAAPDACPDHAEMIAALPAELRALIWSAGDR